MAASQTFKTGAPLAKSAADGTVEEAGTNPAAIIGIATAPASGYDWQYDTLKTVAKSMPFATADQEFRGTLYGTIADVSAVIGATYGVTKQASGYWTVDAAKNASNQRVTITGVDDGVKDGDINIPVTFTILPANRAVVS